MKSKIIATGSYLPDHIVTNHDFEKILDTNDEWIQKRTGIKERRFEEGSNLNMCVKAAVSCDVDVDSIDCIIVCTYTPDRMIPSTASELKRELRIKKTIPCFDLNAACSGFLYGLEVSDALIKSKSYKRVLLVGSDFNSRVLDYTDRSSAILFGDGAGAVVLERSDSPGIIKTVLHGDDDHDELLKLDSLNDFENPFVKREISNDEYFSMEGSPVFKFAIQVMRKSILSVVEKDELESIDYILSHQANRRIIEFAARNLKMAIEKFPMNLDRYGNTSAGSIPILLDEMVRSKKIKKGDRLVLVAFGGGLTYGSSLIEWSY